MLIAFLLTNNYNIKSALALINRGMDKKNELGLQNGVLYSHKKKKKAYHLQKK